jgi:hypothetical protein
MSANISCGGGSEKSIDDGVGDGVAIRMPGQARRIGKEHASQDQRPGGIETVRVVANANAGHNRPFVQVSEE